MPRPIERVGLALVQVPFKAPHPDGPGEAGLRGSILVAVEADGGAVGLGECAPPPAGATDAALDRLWHALADRVAPRLLGLEVDSPAAIADAAASWGELPAPARAGAETALWDLLAQRRHAGLAEILGASPPRVEAGVGSALTVGLAPTLVDLLRSIEPHLSEGYGHLVVPIAPGRDVAFVEAVRQHFPDLVLAIDAGGRFDRSHAEVFRRLDGEQPLWIHCPYPADDLDGLAALQATLDSPISLPATARPAIERGACRMARLSIQEAGGLAEALALHDDLRARNVGCWVAAGPELGVGLAQAIHLATLPGCKDPAVVEPAARWYVDDLVSPPIEFDAPGRFRVPTRPGLGHLLDAPKVRRYQVRHQRWSVA
jgi:O-succinylbenzoate synthase